MKQIFKEHGHTLIVVVALFVIIFLLLMLSISGNSGMGGIFGGLSEKSDNVMNNIGNFYTISYELDGGKVDGVVTYQYSSRSEDFELKEPYKNGYTFIGWTGSNGTVPQKNIVITKGSTGNRQYKANYSATMYTYNILCLSANGNEISRTSLSEVYNTKYVYNPRDINGYETPESKMLHFIERDTVEQFIYNPIEYSIKFNANGGKLTGDIPEQYTVETNTFTLPTPVKTNYTFSGWYENSGLTGTAATALQKGSYGNKQYYAKFTPQNYTISYNLNGGTLSNQVKNYNIETNTFTIANPIKAGYKFLGWVGSNGANPQSNITITKGSIGNRQYEAQWEKEIYYGVDKNTLIISDRPLYSTVKGTISSDGNVAGQAPWISYKDQITSIRFDIVSEKVKPLTTAYWFAGLTNVTSINLTGLDTSATTNMNGMFKNVGSAASSVTLTGQESLNTGNVESFYEIFAYSGFTDIDLSSWDAKSANSMNSMFKGCNNLSSINTPKNIGGNITVDGITSIAFYDVTDGDKEYAAGTFPKGITSSHVLSRMKCVPSGGHWKNGVCMIYTDLNANGGTVKNENGSMATTAHFEMPVGEPLSKILTTPSRSGWIYDGWRRQIDGVQVYPGKPAMFIDTSFKAEWVAYRRINTDGYLDGIASDSLNAYGTYTFQIQEENGSWRTIYTNCQNIWYEAKVGTVYRIKDIKPLDGYEYLNFSCDGISYGPITEYVGTVKETSGYNTSMAFNTKSEINTLIKNTGAKDLVFDKTIPSRSKPTVGTLATFNGAKAYLQNATLHIYNPSGGKVAAPVNCGKLFQGTNVNSIDLRGLDTSATNNMYNMFYATKAKQINLSETQTGNVTSMYLMFGYAPNLTSLDLSNFNTSNVITMSRMFESCTSLANINLSSFNTPKLTDMGQMFFCCYSLRSIDMSTFNTSKVTSFNRLFYCCTNLANIDVSGFNTSSTVYMSGMFEQCHSLKTLDLSNFDTSKCATFRLMFAGDRNLKSLNLSNFNTNNCSDMSIMFSGCSSLTSLNLANFNTSNVVDMEGMFQYCSSLTSLDLSKFSTPRLNRAVSMFQGDGNLSTIYVSDAFLNTNITRSESMFQDCTKLVGGKGTVYNAGYVNAKAAIIDGGIDNPGYFTKK